MSDELLKVMTDVRDRVIKIETKLERLPLIEDKVDKHEKEIVKAKAHINAVKVVTGFFLISLPASAYAVYRMIKGA